MKNISVLIILLITLLLIGCGHNYKNEVVGVWKIISESGRGKMEFTENGKFRQKGGTGRYYLDGNEIKVVWGDDEIILKILSIDDDIMELEQPKGPIIKLQRIK